MHLLKQLSQSQDPGSSIFWFGSQNLSGYIPRKGKSRSLHCLSVQAAVYWDSFPWCPGTVLLSRHLYIVQAVVWFWFFFSCFPTGKIKLNIALLYTEVVLHLTTQESLTLYRCFCVCTWMSVQVCMYLWTHTCRGQRLAVFPNHSLHYYYHCCLDFVFFYILWVLFDFLCFFVFETSSLTEPEWYWSKYVQALGILLSRTTGPRCFT